MNFLNLSRYKRFRCSCIVIASDPALAGERGNLMPKIRDCGACSERSEESPGLLRLGLATVSLLAMTL
jgi:hypothetical protein